MKVVELPTNSRTASVADTLRRIADQIDKGDFGEVRQAIVVSEGDYTDIFRAGALEDASSSAEVFRLLALAQHAVASHEMGE